MKFFKTLAVTVMLGFATAGCVTTGDLVTGTLTNPVTGVDIWRLKNTYAATLQLANDWRAYCYSKPYSVLMADPIAKPVCQNRRQTVRQIQRYQPVAGTAVRQADVFVTNNPTLNAGSVIGIAWSAVTAFQNVVPRVN